MCQAHRTPCVAKAPMSVPVRRTWHQLTRFIALMGLLAVLGGCGNKGDLFLKGEDTESVNEPDRALLSRDPLDPVERDFLDESDEELKERERLEREAAEGLERQ